jgi:hypothetical protein
MSSYCIEDLGKLFTHILFLAALVLNIVDKEKKKQDAIHAGRQINTIMINPSLMQIIIFFPNEDYIINSNVECHCYYITKTK